MMGKLSLTSKLSALPLAYKLIYLAGSALFLFVPNLLLHHFNLKYYALFYALFVGAIAFLNYKIVGKKSFRAMVKFWSIGVVIYFMFAIPRIYMASTLSPYFVFTNLTDRWLYSLLLPLVLLGTFSTGLSFMHITSPLEFLKWERFGLKIMLLMRTLQHAMQVFNETKMALMLQNMWPEESTKLFDFRASLQAIKFSPLLVSTALRNIILYWFPWGWLCFLNKTKRYCQNNKFDVK